MGWGNSTADTLSINATGIGGGIFVGGTRTVANSASGKGLNMTGTSFLANGGSITIESALGNDLRLGASGENVKIGTVTANAANDVTIRGDNYQIDSAVSINTTGNVVFESTNSSWLSDVTFSSSTFNFSNTPSSLRVGKTTNTQSVIFAEDITVNGPITVYGGGLNSISINNKLEATNSTITLTGTSNIIDGASGYLVANNLLLLGGSVTLDNSSNNVGTIAANNISSLTYVNSSALTIGTISSTNGVTSTGNVSIQTLNSISINNKLEATNSTITLTGTSNIIDGASGYLVANNLLLLGGSVTLDNSSNNVGTIAANNISSLTYVNSSALTIGTISSTNGVTSTGDVSIQTLSGNLTVNKNISTNSTASTAVTLNASKNSSSGTSSSGDIIVSGGSITVGSGGRATLYTGSISGSSGVTSLVGSGSGKFRYNSDETTTNYTTALGSGIYAIYREQPTITVGINNASITYGDALPTYSFSLGSSSVNGDTYAQAITSDATVSVGGSQSTSGNYTAGTHTLSSSSILTSGLGYAVNSSITNGTLTVAKKDITISGLTSSNKIYDGTTNATISNWGSVTTGVGSETLALSHSTAEFISKDVANGITVTASGYSLLDGTNGGLASNYQLSSTSTTTTANITKANLTVSANNDAKFVTTSDVSGYQGVSYSGFVGGEDSTTAGLTGTLNISRSNASTNSAGTYNGVLIASGLSANNYNISYVAGDYTIVGANQLLINVTDVSNTYGTTTNYNIANAQYWNPNANGGLGGVVSLIGITNNGSNNFTISDGVGGSATFTLAELNAVYSTANKLKVGSYQLGTTGTVTENSTNFSNLITVVGNHQVNQQSLSASTTGGVSKVYDGTTSMNGVTLGLSTLQTNDIVTVNGTGAFSSADVSRDGSGNVLSDKSYTISNLALSGTDANNYYLSGGTSFSGSNGTITPKDITAITGITATNKTYDGTTTATLSTTGAGFTGIITGDTITVATSTGTFSDKNVGTGKTVSITGLTLGGTDALNYNLTTTTASTTATISRLNSVTWTGNGGDTNWFNPANWAGGAVPDLSNVANVVIPTGVTVTFATTSIISPAVSPDSLAHAVNIDSIGTLGSLTQTDGYLNIGSGGMSLNTFTQNGGTTTNSGTTTLTNYNQTDGSFSGTGNFTTANFAQTGGTTTLTNNFTVTNDFSQGSSGSVTVGGNTSITDTTGGTTIGNLHTNGTTSIASTGGAITQTNGTSIVSRGTTTLDASNGVTKYDITLDGNNDFQSTVNANGNNISLKDLNDLLLGNITANGTFNAYSGGTLSQTSSSAVQVNGTTTLYASNDINLPNLGNRFASDVNIVHAVNVILGSDQRIHLGANSNINPVKFLGSINTTSSFVPPVTDTISKQMPTIAPVETTTNVTAQTSPLGGAGGNTTVTETPTAVTTTQNSSTATQTTTSALSGGSTLSASVQTNEAGGTNIANQSTSNEKISFDGMTVGATANGESVKAIVIQGSATSQTPAALMVGVKVGEGFSFAIPQSTVSQVAQSITPNAQATQLEVVGLSQNNGNPLPTWLSFDPKSMSFNSTNVPQGGLPLTVNVSISYNGVVKTIEVALKDK